MENEYILIGNVTEELKKLYEKSLAMQGYEMIENQDRLLFARKLHQKMINQEKEKSVLALIVSMARKHKRKEILYMNLTKEMSLIMKENMKDNQVQQLIRQKITKSFLDKGEKE